MPKQRYTSQIAPQGFVTAPSFYDGTNDFQLRGADLTGIADGKAGTISCWLNFSGGDGVSANLFASQATNQFIVVKSTGGALQISGKNTSSTTILLINTVTGFNSTSGWVHFLASWDLNAGAGQIYVNDTSNLSNVQTLTNDTIDYTHTNWALGANVAGANKITACLAEFLFHTTYIDLSIIANRRKFISQFGRPVYLGANGSVPLGVQPLVYAPNGDASTNKGSGGNFTTTGALTACASAP